MTIDQKRYYRELYFMQQHRQNTLRNAAKLMMCNSNPVFSPATPAPAGSTSHCNCVISAELMKTIASLQEVIFDLYSQIDELNLKLSVCQYTAISADVQTLSTDLSSLSAFVATQTPNGQLQHLQESIDELSSKVLDYDIEFTDGGTADYAGGPDIQL